MKKTSLSFMITAGILGGIFTFSVSPHLADAFDLSGTLGAVIGGAAVPPNRCIHGSHQQYR